MDYYFSSYNQHNNVSKSSVFLFSIVCLLLGIGLGILGYYFINNYMNNKPEEKPVEIITSEDLKVKLPQSDIDIYDPSSDSCIKRDVKDSDFDRTVYPVDDDEIIYF